METTVIYNGVTIKNVLTETISHDGEKESTGVDQLGVRVVYEGTGVVHCSAQTARIGVRLPSPLATGLDLLLSQLTKDRRPFQVYIGNSLLYDISPGAAEKNAPAGTVTANLEQMDLDNGPRTHVTVMKIISGYSAMIRFRVEFLIPNCGGGNAVNNSGLVNYRFWIAEDIDCKTWLTTRTYTGRIRVAHKNISPHALGRQVVIPPLQRGFKREVAGLHESQDGLHLDFTIRDQEMYAAAPFDQSLRQGAVDWSGYFAIAQSYPLNTMTEVNFTLTGPKSTGKDVLIRLGLQVMEAKTHSLSLFKSGAVAFNPQFGSSFLEHFAIREELDSNKIEFACKIRHTATFVQLGQLFAPNGKLAFGTLPPMDVGYDKDVAFYPPLTGSLTGIFLSLLQTPCQPAGIPQAVDPKPKPPKPPKRIPRQDDDSFTYRGQPTSASSVVSQSQVAGMYLDYLMDSDIHIRSGRIALPTGASRNSKANPLAVVRLCQDTATRDVRIEASRIHLPPELPKPNVAFKDQNGIGHTMIGDAEITAGAPILSADSRKFMHRAEMQICYALSRAPGSNDSIPVGAVPYRTSNFQDASRRLPPSIFIAPEKLLA